MSEKLMTSVELAERLSCSVGHVRTLYQENRIPMIRIGRSVRFSPSAIDAWVAAKQIKSVT